MSRKMIFFDIDGTIVAEGSHYLPQSTVDAIKQARANGHLTFINTGRTYFNIEDTIRNIGFDGYVCGCGTYVYLDDKPIFSHSIPHDTCVEIIHRLREYDISALFEENSHVFFDDTAPATKKIMDLKARFGANAFDASVSLDDPNMVFDKFVAWINTRSNFTAFHSYITEEFDYIDRGSNFAEIIPKGFSKATGIKFLMDYFDIPLCDCFAIGDSTNDLSMLDFVPNSIAMGKSMKEILPYCSYQTAYLEDDGIAKALAHFGIID